MFKRKYKRNPNLLKELLAYAEKRSKFLSGKN